MTALRALYLIAPAVTAGVVHAVVLKLGVLRPLARPLDGGRGVFGANKTWRGPVVMIVASSVVVALQRLGDVGALALVDYRDPRTLLLGPALGLGYSLAELPNSFVKRRLGIEPGARRSRAQYVADQGDSAAGVALAVIVFIPDASVVAAVALLGFALHAAVDRLLYAFHVKEVTL